MEAFDIFPCQLYDEVFMLFFLPALSQVARHATHTTASSTKRSQLARQLTIPTIGNRPTSSSTQQHRRHNKLSLAKYRILIRLAGEYLQLTEDQLTSSIYSKGQKSRPEKFHSSFSNIPGNSMSIPTDRPQAQEIATLAQYPMYV